MLAPFWKVPPWLAFQRPSAMTPSPFGNPPRAGIQPLRFGLGPLALGLGLSPQPSAFMGGAPPVGRAAGRAGGQADVATLLSRAAPQDIAEILRLIEAGLVPAGVLAALGERPDLPAAARVAATSGALSTAHAANRMALAAQQATKANDPDAAALAKRAVTLAQQAVKLGQADGLARELTDAMGLTGPAAGGPSPADIQAALDIQAGVYGLDAAPPSVISPDVFSGVSGGAVAEMPTLPAQEGGFAELPGLVEPPGAVIDPALLASPEYQALLSGASGGGVPTVAPPFTPAETVADIEAVFGDVGAGRGGTLLGGLERGLGPALGLAKIATSAAQGDPVGVSLGTAQLVPTLGKAFPELTAKIAGVIPETVSKALSTTTSALAPIGSTGVAGQSGVGNIGSMVSTLGNVALYPATAGMAAFGPMLTNAIASLFEPGGLFGGPKLKKSQYYNPQEGNWNQYGFVNRSTGEWRIGGPGEPAPSGFERDVMINPTITRTGAHYYDIALPEVMPNERFNPAAPDRGKVDDNPYGAAWRWTMPLPPLPGGSYPTDFVYQGKPARWIEGGLKQIPAWNPGGEFGAQNLGGSQPGWSIEAFAPSLEEQIAQGKAAPSMDVPETTLGASFQAGGPVPRTGPYRLHAGEFVIPAPVMQTLARRGAPRSLGSEPVEAEAEQPWYLDTKEGPPFQADANPDPSRTWRLATSPAQLREALKEGEPVVAISRDVLYLPPQRAVPLIERARKAQYDQTDRGIETLGALTREMAEPIGPFGLLHGSPSAPQPRSTRPLPLPGNLLPASFEARGVYGRAFQGLPQAIQAILAKQPWLSPLFYDETRPQTAPRTGRWEAPAGGEAGYGADIPGPAGPGAWTWFPRSGSAARESWGSVTPEQIARHELTHLGVTPQLQGEEERALAGRFAREPWPADVARRLGEAHPTIGAALTAPAETPGRVIPDILRRTGLSSDLPIWAMNEYLASLAEHGGEPRRVPLLPARMDPAGVLRRFGLPTQP